MRNVPSALGLQIIILIPRHMDMNAPEQNAAEQAQRVEQSSPAAETTAPVTPDVDADASSTDAQTEKKLVDETVEVAPEAPEAVSDDDAAAADGAVESFASIATLDAEGTVERAAAILERPAAEINRDEVSRLRQHFANLRKEEVDAQRAAFVENGGVEAEFAEEPSETEERFKDILNAIKEKKAAYAAALEAERAANLERKKAIIEQICALAEDTDNVNRTFPRYRELQDEFNAIGEVPATDDTEIWKRFQEARERYSDNLKINKELRDYDFKKNLELKEQIIADAAALAGEGDVIAAFKRLQELHVSWRQIGPVAKELRDDIWARFKEASQEVNKRYQAYFEERKAREAENEAGKTAICERVEAMDFAKLNSFAAWDQMTNEIKQAQEDWKKLGFASRKMNNALFNRFRATCDTFFALKANYFKTVKEELARNLAAKTALVERAEALKDSTDWKKATDEFVAMQKEWRTIGTVAKRYSDSVWRRFQTACDYFFEQKKAATSGVRRTEQANLQAKRDLIKELDTITAETPKDDARALINDLQERWKSIGHVPFREKDVVYEDFRNRIAEVRAQFGLSDRRRRDDRVADNDGADRPVRDRERQVRLLETRRAELRTYENNLGFLNATSKSGNSLVRDFERKIERLKADITALEQQIRQADENAAQ